MATGPEDPGSWFQVLTSIIDWAAAVLAGILGGIMVYTHARIDRVERALHGRLDKMDETFRRDLDTARDRVEAGNKEAAMAITNAMRQLETKLDSLRNEALSQRDKTDDRIWRALEGLQVKFEDDRKAAAVDRANMLAIMVTRNQLAEQIDRLAGSYNQPEHTVRYRAPKGEV